MQTLSLKSKSRLEPAPAGPACLPARIIIISLMSHTMNMWLASGRASCSALRMTRGDSLTNCTNYGPMWTSRANQATPSDHRKLFSGIGVGEVRNENWGPCKGFLHSGLSRIRQEQERLPCSWKKKKSRNSGSPLYGDLFSGRDVRMTNAEFESDRERIRGMPFRGKESDTSGDFETTSHG